MQSFIGLVALLTTTIINIARRPAAVDHQQHRRRRRDHRDGGLRADPAVLREPPAGLGPVRHVVHGGPRGRQLPAGLPRRHVHGPVRRLRLRHRRDVRRGDHRRQPPGAARRPVGDLAVGHRRRDLPPRRDPVLQGHRRRGRQGPGVRLPDRRHDQAEPHVRHRRAHARRPLPGRHPHRRLRVHPGHPGRDRAADVLDGSRPATAASAGPGVT